MVVPVKVLSMGQTIELLVLNSNTWNHLTVHKQMNCGSF